MPEFKLIIGLGNPEKEYENTNHNVGFMAVDFLGKGIKSGVYMNKSGEFVKQEIKKHKVKPENLLIIHDDSDIELGKYKLSFGRNSAGHKGAQNIINQLKTKNFWRLRIGIRPPKEKTRTKADELVLKKISPANKKKLETVFKTIKNIIS
ncbi:MAG: aminoacyl-tRNA hydrolase [Patescibacteria group bacterium]